ncbi:hypothetical protein KBC03_02375 [Patescibacteria group bacterium]|nr:hypothetical protein [Patescibacteria group bacterium]
MKQKAINIQTLHYLISDHVLAKKHITDLDQVLDTQSDELVDDAGAQFRSVNLSSSQLAFTFFLTLSQYVTHCICIRAIEGNIPAPVPNIFESYEKKKHKLHMYHCIDIMQVHMAKELQEKRALINPMGDVAYL